MGTERDATIPIFGDLLRRRRLDAGMTQMALADLAGLSKRGISDLERGARTRPQRETVKLLADALGLVGPKRALFIAAARQGKRASHHALVPVASASFPDVPVPRPLDALVGREHEVAMITAMIRHGEVRLVTLTGPGGVGKTRLAIATAAALHDDFANEVVFVDLAPIRDPALVLPAIAERLDIRDASERRLAQRLQDRLAKRTTLLVLDNVEQVLGAAPAIADLLTACPEVTMLTTSRSPLRVAGEQVFSVPPLSLPEGSEAISPDRLRTSEAGRLFEARAAAASVGFTFDNANAAAVAEVCRRLEGLPLAIELAAARVALLPPEALLARLEPRLPMLSGGRRDAPARQQTMRDAIAWSYGLLDSTEQTLFRRLAVFTGGFTLEAAEAVTEESGGRQGYETPGTQEPVFSSFHSVDVLDLIASLVANSLLRPDKGPHGQPRFRMLETVREYGLERLAASGEEAAVRDRHATWCLNFAEQYWAEDDYWVEDPGWLARVEPEHDNMREALAWLERINDGVGLLRLAAALHPFWDVRDHRSEAVAWLERGLAHGQGTPPHARILALAGLGRNLERQGYYARATSVHEELLALAREHHDTLWETRALHALGLGALNQERYDEAIPLIEGALAAYQQLGDEGGASWCRYCCGIIAYGRGDLAAAATYLETALAWRRNHGSVVILAVHLIPLGLVACDQGEYGGAAARLAESLSWWELDGGESGELLAEWLAAVARLAACRGRSETAVRLYGASEALFDAIGEPLVVPPHSLYRRHVDTLRDTLGAEAFAASWAAGRAIPLEEAIEKARTIIANPVDAEAAPVISVPNTSPALTSREQEVLRLMAEGWTDRAIADALFLSRRTVNAHVANLLGKLGVDSRRDAAALVTQRPSGDAGPENHSGYA